MSTDSFAEAMRIVDGFRPWVVAEAEKVMDAFLENLETCRKTPEADVYLMWLELRKKLIHDAERRVPAIDTDFSITLLPCGKGVLGVVHTEHDDWYEAWCAHPGVEEYAFWDNMEKPEGVSSEEWNERAEAWSILTPQPACLQGFTINLVDPMGPMPKMLRTVIGKRVD